MENIIAPDGPFAIEIKVQFTCIAGEHEGYTAHASIDLPPGVLPTAEIMRQNIEAAQAQLGENFRLATRHEFVQELLRESSGVNMNFAIPGPDEFTMFGDN